MRQSKKQTKDSLVMSINNVVEVYHFKLKREWKKIHNISSWATQMTLHQAPEAKPMTVIAKYKFLSSTELVSWSMKYYVLRAKTPEYFTNELFQDGQIEEFDGMSNFSYFSFKGKRNSNPSLPESVGFTANFSLERLKERTMLTNNKSWFIVREDVLALMDENDYEAAVSMRIKDTNGNVLKGVCFFLIQQKVIDNVLDKDLCTITYGKVFPDKVSIIVGIYLKKDLVHQNIFVLREYMSCIMLSENMKSKLEQIDGHSFIFVDATEYSSLKLY